MLVCVKRNYKENVSGVFLSIFVSNLPAQCFSFYIFYVYIYMCNVPLMLLPIIALSAASGFCLIKWRNDSSPTRWFLNET